MSHKTSEFMTGAHCAICYTPRGEQHEPGCPWEQCPFCKEQLLGCQCWMKQFSIVEEEGKETRDLTPKEDEMWEQILKENAILFGQETEEFRNP